MANIKDIREKTIALAKKGKLPEITAHILFPVTNALPNRDETGAQKSAMMDCLRMRISSQCFKRPVTEHLMENGSMRTRQVASYLSDRYFHEHDVSDEAKQQLDTLVSSLFSKKEKAQTAKDKDKDLAKKTQLLFYSAQDLDELYDLVAKAMESGEKPGDAAAKIRTHMENTADSRKINLAIALIGRMSTDSMLRSVYSAMRVSHAYSVTEMEGESDFYTAVDDYSDPKYRFLHDTVDDKGVAQMDDKDINSAIMYVCCCINMRTLMENILQESTGLDDEAVDRALALARYTAAQVIELFADVRPDSSQTGMFSNARPNAMAVVLSDSHGKTADNAFQNALDRKDADRKSIQSLRDHLSDDSFTPSYEHTTGYWITLKEYADIPAPENYTRTTLRGIRETIEKGDWS